MEFRTKVVIKPSVWRIEPCEQLLFVGSCFAENIGRRFQQDLFRATVNPFGVMYNPVSVQHTIQKWENNPAFTVISLGTNHVYIDRQSGLVVDNCMKRPASDFEERELTVAECYNALAESVDTIEGRVIVTVSPIRYKKYGFHESQLSKATLLLAVDKLVKDNPTQVAYFPSYEILNDELRDYRFYEADMLHPSAQAVEYIFCRFAETYFSERTNEFLREWKPLKEALAHRPFNPESKEYKDFFAKTLDGVNALRKKYPDMPMPPIKEL